MPGYNKKNMEGLQKGFQASGTGPSNEEMVDAIKRRKKAIAEKVSGWFRKTEIPKDSPNEIEHVDK